jgi:hypothetical protein
MSDTSKITDCEPGSHDMAKHKIYLTHASTFDYKTLLYQPLKASSLADNYQIIFPHETDSAARYSKEIIKNSDLVLAEVSYPSTGQGIELGWAEIFRKPIIFFIKMINHIQVHYLF